MAKPAPALDRDAGAGSAVDGVIAHIKSGIRAGRYAPGQRLVEPDLTEALGVSRSSLREALRRLAAEGFVELQHFRGARVRKMTRADVLELTEIRAVLEGYAAATAAARIDAPGRDALLALERSADGARARDAAGYGAYNAAFHEAVLRLGRHQHLPGFVEHTRLAVFRLQFDFLLLTPARIRTSRAEHRVIAKAILKGDAVAAEAAMRGHILGNTAAILDAPEEYLG
ncbi:GntR family transcriptional regulator [Roseomonas sp. BN140053]|uniref:GntR family transcriptional regulator n=1 Tax=Roseomonas sp. BN140053 TaxID=3391898 RepID=UPI0039E84715